MDFMDLEKTYDRFNREVLRKYDLYGKLLNDVKSMYPNSLACIRLKVGESEHFRINSGVRQGCIISLCIFNVFMDAVMKEMKMGMGRSGVRFPEAGREWILLGLLYVDDLV